MPDFAPNVTGRYKLHYSVVGRGHTIQVRVARGAIFADIVNNSRVYLLALFTALAPNLCADLTFLSAEAALTDSDLFFPAAVPTAVVGAIALALYSGQDSISHLTFSGRGAFGSKTNVKVYGWQANPDTLPINQASDFVLLATESAAISSAIAALNGGGASIVAIDNSPPTYHSRATLKVNDFWLRRLRRGL